MSAATSQGEQALQAELERARERLSSLAREVRSVDDALESLSTERAQHRLLNDACVALEALGEQQASGLFWGDAAGVAQGGERLRAARGRVDAFEKRIGEMEDQRQALLDEIDRAELNAEVLEDDVYELRRAEEERKLEWVVEREASELPARETLMPWSGGGEDERRYRRSLATSLALALALGLVIPHIPLPVPERAEAIELPERLTRLLEAERRLPPPPPPRETESRKEPEAVTPQEPPRVAKEPAPQEGPQPGPGLGPSTGPATGILAFREKLSGIAEARPGTRLGLQARISSSGDAPSGRPERSLVTTQAPGSSGGINLAALSRGGGGGGKQLSGVQVARATSSIGGGGGGRAGGTGSAQSGGPALGRTDEEIQIVFDRHKSALYRLYNRELRNDPTLRGQIVLRLTIEPDGSVSLCKVHASDMKAPQLAAQVVERVRSFDFGAKEGIAAVTILYPIDFLPAT